MGAPRGLLFLDQHHAWREVWVDRCAHRLVELDPRRSLPDARALADDLWSDVSAFAPEIAAEMEHEAGAWSDQ